MSRIFLTTLFLSTSIVLGCSNNGTRDILENTTADDVAEYKRILADEERQMQELMEPGAKPK